MGCLSKQFPFDCLSSGHPLGLPCSTFPPLRPSCVPLNSFECTSRSTPLSQFLLLSQFTGQFPLLNPAHNNGCSCCWKSVSKGNLDSDSYVQLKLEFFAPSACFSLFLQLQLLLLHLPSVSAYSLWPFVCSASGKLFIILSTNACSSQDSQDREMGREAKLTPKA